jgi:RNA polymerase sigma factor (sigma-70 family)
MDPSWLLRAFDENHLPLFRFAYRMTGSVADAEDIVQECFLQLLRPGCSFDASRASLRTYLFGVVRNQALKRVAKPVPDRFDLVCGASPEQQMLQTETGQTVARAVAELPANQREVLILAHYEQMPLAEIARVLEIEVTAVKSRLQRARAQLKETLAEYAGMERKR